MLSKVKSYQLLWKDIGNHYEKNHGNLLSEETTSTVLKYDFAYIRYARPYFYTGAFPDEETFKERDVETAKLSETERFKIKAGDTPDCGLTVKRAEYLHDPVISAKYDPQMDIFRASYINGDIGYVESDIGDC